MATNVNAPFGLAPVSYSDGSTWNGQARMYCIFSTDTNAYAIGDPVASDATNFSDANGVACVTLATAGTGNALRGVIVGTAGTVFGGPGGDPAAPYTTIVPATKTKNYYVMVADDSAILFEIQEISTGTPQTAVVVGLNQNLASGTNNGFVSGWTMSNSSPAASGSTIQLKIMQSIQRSDNVRFAASQRWLVKINNHELNAGTTGV